ncbi:conserved hypothetical protein [Coccidioides posadasii str. Silveira]|uniref:HORMA domain-containing protein n=1 Tax=Coccidioides posadasii (strain RMSCC 757 / Silveira) TaxID=443226 RepID=E9CVJ7_COCPS|nr:conserved hypothetical protein [Coccidioides posadasii str. Silveira]
MARNIQPGSKMKAAGGTLMATCEARMMAPISVHKQKQEQMKTEQTTHVPQKVEMKQEVAIRQKQSQELVQILLNASIGSLFYLRGFLPLICFDTRYLDAKSETSISYEDFTGSDSKPAAPRKSQPLRILLRNRNSTADAILNLLEYGVFDALGKRVLEAVQLTISRDRNTPLQVLESYTFTFAYKVDGKHKVANLASVSLDNGKCTMEVGTLRSAKVGLEMIIRRLITLSTILPNLPCTDPKKSVIRFCLPLTNDTAKRFLHVHLFYTEDCPLEYEPPGFKNSALEDIRFPRIENWTKQTQSCGMMDGPYHRVGLKVTSLRWSGTGDDQIPEDLKYSDDVSREIDVGIDHKAKGHSQLGDEAPYESTQAREDEAGRKILQKMLEPSSIDTTMAPTQQFIDSTAKNDATAAKPQLSQAKVDEIEKRRSQPQLAHPMHARSTGSNCDAGAVSCQCGWNQEEGAMIYCRFCDTKQHLSCYGFHSIQDPKLPNTHACYKCLLGDAEGKILQEMNTLVLLRRALNIIIEEGYPRGTKAFAEKLHCNGQAILQITGMLKKKGFLKATPGSKSKGFSEKGLPSFVIPESKGIRERIDQEILSPFANISHHYDIPRCLQQRATSETCPHLADGMEDHPVFGTYLARSRRRLWPLDDNLYRESQGLASAASSASPMSPESTAPTASSDNLELQEPGPGGRATREPQIRGRKRKLSNATQPIDIGDPDYDDFMDESSG